VTADATLDRQVRAALGALTPPVAVTGLDTLAGIREVLEDTQFDVAFLDDASVDGDVAKTLQELSGGFPPAVVILADADREAQRTRELSFLTHERLLHAEVEPRALARSMRHAVEARQLRRHLAVSGRMEVVGRFASSTIHDLSNLLTVILAASERMRAAMPPGHEWERDCEIMHDGAFRAVALTHQALSFSRTKPSVPAVFGLGAMVVSSEAVLRALAGPGVDLRVSCASGRDQIRADTTQIEQVLFNLVANARDALPQGGTIGIRTRVEQIESLDFALDVEPGTYVVLTVSDDGVGMDLDVRAHAFEPFFTTKEAGKGTGLGLSTVYRIVRDWGGGIRIESRPGAGTSVSVFLPVVHRGAAVTEVLGQPTPSATRGGSETILVVEDEDAVADLVVDMLSAEGYQVLRVGRPLLAIDTCYGHDGTIDLLLTDIVMPEMSGVELAEQIRIVRPGIRVLFMSGYSDHSGTIGGLLDESMRLLSKPFDRKALVGSVREALDADPA
jgi:signal transduction histidine kinase/ActR/RegA family two-component response regulator